MPDLYDVLTIAAIVAELDATIAQGRIQRIGLVDAKTIGAEVYAHGQRRYLLASADERYPRLRLTAEMPSLDPNLVTPFGLLLRKYLRGGVILSVDQPPLERLVQFSIARRLPPLTTRTLTPLPPSPVEPGEEGEPLSRLDGRGVGVRVEHDDDDDDDNAAEESGDLVYISFYVELMGRRSNLILVADDGTIMDSAKRVPPAMSRVRPVLPHLPYAPPPPLDRLDPRRITAGDAGRLLASLPGETPLARALVGAYRGMSPRMAEEIAFRVGGDAAATVAAVPPDSGPALAREMAALLAPLERDTWQPRVYRERDGEGAAEVVAFSPAPMAHLAANHDEIAVESISAAAAMAEGAAARPPQERHAQRRQRLCDAIAAARERAERRLASLADAADRAEEAERLKARGELIYAHLWQIALGQSELAVDDMVIPLDPHLSASENAQAYFERYRKAQSGARQVPELAAESRAEIAYLDQLTTLVAHAPGFAELEALAAEWAEHAGQASAAGFPAKRKQPAPRRPRPLVDAAGNSVYVGHSGPQNELITFDIAGADDTWLHARGVGGSHVVIRWRTPDGAENAETVAAAAALAAWYSAARESGSVEVDVARRRHVRKLKGGGPGMVTYRNERTIRVGPASEADLSGILRER